MLGEGHLRRAVASYMEHYHLERCRQPANRGGPRTRLGARRADGTAGRDPKPLLPKSRMISRSNIGTGRDELRRKLGAAGALVKGKLEKPGLF